MLKLSMPVRLCITAGLLAGSSFLMQTASHGEPVIARQPLRALPYTIGRWSGQELPIDQEIVKAVGVTDYTNRLYQDPSQVSVQLYVGYYASQRTGDTIHSPKNCLPGTGWEPLQSNYLAIPVSGNHKIEVNEYVIQKDQDRQLVFYWYQGRGRVIASEYRARLWMAVDALSLNRTDSALVRLVTPMKDSQEMSRDRLIDFTKAFFPDIDGLIPK